MKDCDNLAWVDLEMTGLNCAADRVLETAIIITNIHLEIIAVGPVCAIHQPDEVLDAMDSWNTRQHRKSGLLERSRKSTCNYKQAEVETLAFIRQWVGYQESPMCGNSVCQDRRFLARFMPDLENYFHYRNIDVSTLKELSYRWAPNLQKFKKKNCHQACADIKESIAELKYYSEYFIKKQ
ncbi:oligoribonuclease [Desulforhopalus vacuolatus]|uniref:oligoribonuclease n=1 Tax=Desulforhopalus vacuolatus TaxID=40414 RepID=UPI0019633179|nr:oligoribonuclease [Desulforhopalus vacuolatus]MBM9518951.1 oligoribonuclease [Desulforhopalus vacuolatus]